MPTKNVKGLAPARSAISIPATEPDDTQAVTLDTSTLILTSAPARSARAKVTGRKAVVAGKPTPKKKGKQPAPATITPAMVPLPVTTQPPNPTPETSSTPSIRALQIDIASIHARIEQLQLHDIATMTHRLDEMESVDVALLEERMDGVEGSETDLDARLKVVEEYISSARDMFAEVKGDISGLKLSVQGMKDVVGSAVDTANWAKGTADEALTVAEEAKEEGDGLLARMASKDSSKAEIETLKMRLDALSTSLDALRQSTKAPVPAVTGTAHTPYTAPVFPSPARPPPAPQQPYRSQRPQNRRSTRNTPYPPPATNYARHHGPPNPNPITGHTIVVYGPHPSLPVEGKDNPLPFLRHMCDNYTSTYFNETDLNSAVRIPYSDTFSLNFKSPGAAEAFVQCVHAKPRVPGVKATIPSNLEK